MDERDAMSSLQTVTGPVSPAAIELADGHDHLWIEPPDGVAPDARLELADEALVTKGLVEFRAAGGDAVIDCQPGGCGRDAGVLERLSRRTGVRVCAVTGFHLRKYYASEYWLWSATGDAACDHFTAELDSALSENSTARAAAVKVAFTGEFEGPEGVLAEAAAVAARRTGAAVLVHTEKGRNAEALLPFFTDRGVPADRLYICHLDKRADLELHRDLARAGVLLGYDTFLRPEYRPETGAWRLIEALVSDGLGSRIAIGLDQVRPQMWRNAAAGGGPAAIPRQIVPRLNAMGLDRAVVQDLTGGNVARRLARKDKVGPQ
jgi:phosphotriesterase-related protein